MPKPTHMQNSQYFGLIALLLVGFGILLPVSAQQAGDKSNLSQVQSKDGEHYMSNLTQAVLEHDTDARNIAAAMGQAAVNELAPLLTHQDASIRQRAVMALGGIDILITKTALFSALDDADLNVMHAALAEIEQQQDKLSVPLLVGLLDKLQDDNAKNRIILVLGKRLDAPQSPALEKYCNVEQSQSVALHSMAALAKIGIEQRRKQFSAYLLTIKDSDAFAEAFQLVEYIDQPWLIATLRLLLSNKQEYKSLGGHFPGFPSKIRVCDAVVMLISSLLPQLSLSFDASVYANFTDEQIAELNYAASTVKY